MARELIDYIVLDSLADDIESLEDILRMINSQSPRLGWRHVHSAPFTREEVVPAILRNIRDGLVSPLVFSVEEGALIDLEHGMLPTSRLDDFWFRLTPRGRLVHEAWDPPPVPGSLPTPADPDADDQS